MSPRVKRFVVAVALAVCVVVAVVTHERVTDAVDIIAAGRETVDIGDHVVAVLERDSRISYSIGRSMLSERVAVQQLNGTAIYRVREGALALRSAGGALEVDGNVVVVVDGARYAVAEGAVDARGLAEDASLLRALDDVNNGRGGDLLQRLGELERMRADLERERAARHDK